MNDVREWISGFLQTNTDSFGAIDLVVLSRQRHDPTALEAVQLLLAGVQSHLATVPTFTSVCVICPPEITLAWIDDRNPPGRLTVRTARDRSASSIADVVSSCPAHSAVVVLFAELYDSGRPYPHQPEATTTSLSGTNVRQHRAESLAAHHLNCLASLLRDKASHHYLVVLSASGPWPNDSESSLRRLSEFDNILVLTSSTNSPFERLDEWTSYVRDKMSVPAVRDRIVASGVREESADEVLAFALYRGERPLAAFDVVRDLLSRTIDPDPALLVFAARVALDAGLVKEVPTLLGDISKHPQAPPPVLRAAVEIARELNDPTLTLEAATTLHRLLPSDAWGAEILAETMIRFGRFAEAIEVLDSLAGHLRAEGGYLKSLATYRVGQSDQATFISNTDAAFKQRALADAIFAAAARRSWDEVDELSPSITGDSYASDTVRALSVAIRQWCLHPSERNNDDPPVARWIAKSIEVLSQHPGDTQNRLELHDILSADTLGESLGIACLLPIILSPEHHHTSNASQTIQAGCSSDAEAFRRFFRDYLEKWFHGAIAPHSLPIGELDLDQLLAGGLASLDHFFSMPTFESDDARTVSIILACLLDVAHTRTPTSSPAGCSYAINVVHYTASMLAIRGRDQMARDIIESALRIASNTKDPATLTDAWLGFADVCLRTQNARRAGLALALAARTLPSEGRRRARFHALATRALRDLGLLHQARAQLELMQSVIRDHPSAGDTREIEMLRWSLVAAVSQVDGATFDELSLVCRDAPAIFRSETETPTNRVAAAQCFLQAARRLSDLGYQIDQDLLDDARKSLTEVTTTASDASTEPRLDDLRRAVARITTRFRDDLITDARGAQLLARRILAGESATLAVRLAAIEAIADLETCFEPEQPRLNMLVSDRATARVFERARDGKDISGLIEILDAPTGPGRIGRLVDFIRDPDSQLALLNETFRNNDIMIDALALVGDGVARFRILNGSAEWLLESQEVFEPRQLAEYEKNYPFGYAFLKSTGFIDDDHATRSTLSRLGFSGHKGDVSLRCAIPDPQLLVIPTNLHLLEDVFSGDLTPTCQAPSIGWLLEAYERRERPVPWRASVWTLPEGEDGLLAPISIAAEGLEEELASLGVEVQRNVKLGEIHPTPVLWLVGHGGVDHGGRFFTRIADERGHVDHIQDLVACCRGAELVVLVVCSAGVSNIDRVDGRALGIPFELLRQGARSVIASPWPLDARVAVKWSARFSQSLLDGTTVAQAAFDASRKLSDYAPRDRLAMHVYGDPWLRVDPIGVVR